MAFRNGMCNVSNIGCCLGLFVSKIIFFVNKARHIPIKHEHFFFIYENFYIANLLPCFQQFVFVFQIKNDGSSL